MKERAIASSISFGPLTLNLARKEAFLAGKRVHATPTEYRILALLVEHSDRVVTKAELMAACGKGRDDWPNIVNVHIRALRVKFGRYAWILETAWGSGFRVASQPKGGREPRPDPAARKGAAAAAKSTWHGDDPLGRGSGDRGAAALDGVVGDLVNRLKEALVARERHRIAGDVNAHVRWLVEKLRRSLGSGTASAVAESALAASTSARSPGRKARRAARRSRA